MFRVPGSGGGEQGEQGETGPAGPQGEQGEPGTPADPPAADDHAGQELQVQSVKATGESAGDASYELADGTSISFNGATNTYKVYKSGSLIKFDLLGSTILDIHSSGTVTSRFGHQFFTIISTDSAARGTVGSYTSHKIAGSAVFAAGQSTITVTNNTVNSESHVFAMLQASDATMTHVLRVVPGSGSFVITGNLACTADTNVCWVVIS